MTIWRAGYGIRLNTHTAKCGADAFLLLHSGLRAWLAYEALAMRFMYFG